VGDLQWWWRDDEYADPTKQVFWENRRGTTGGFVLLSQAYRSLDYEILLRLGQSPIVQDIVAWGLHRLCELAEADPSQSPYTLFMRQDHQTFHHMARHLGFRATEEALVQTILDLRTGILAVPVPAGYQVRSIQPGDLVAGKPPVLHISAAMYRRVQETSLYREDMHLVVVAPDTRIAAECICWVDPVNGIGVFEPVRTQEGFERRGLARAMMAEGLRNMAARGVRWAKVSHYRCNTAAAALYRAVGFREIFARLVYAYQKPARTM
jgi:ribosomal protein S18 acetylase RimI-like enzyme